MTIAHQGLLDRLDHLLGDLRLDPDDRSVTVGDETVTGDNRTRLRQDLGPVLYRHWHSGSAARPGEWDPRRDYDFEDLLREATPHRTSRTPAVVRSALIDSPLGRHVLFDVGRVRLRVPGDESPTPLPEIGTRTTLELPAIRPTLSPGFFLVNGSAGGHETGGHMLRLYLHVDEPSMAPAVWHAVLSRLEGAGATYRAKVLAKADQYPRRDAIVVYLTEESWHAVGGVVAAVRNLPGLNPAHSVMTSPIADGVAYGWEPRDTRPGWDRMSLGQHRTMAVADGVARHLFDGRDLAGAVAEALADANADPLAPHRNADSPLVEVAS